MGCWRLLASRYREALLSVFRSLDTIDEVDEKLKRGIMFEDFALTNLSTFGEGDQRFCSSITLSSLETFLFD